MDVSAICRLADKLRDTTERIEAEKIAEASPGTRETHGDILILDDAGRGKVVIQFARRPLTAARADGCRCAASSAAATAPRSGDRRTFRRGENIALDRARHCVEHILEDRRKLEAARQPVPWNGSQQRPPTRLAGNPP